MSDGDDFLSRWSGLERVPRWQWPLGKLGALLVITNSSDAS